MAAPVYVLKDNADAFVVELTSPSIAAVAEVLPNASRIVVAPVPLLYRDATSAVVPVVILEVITIFEARKEPDVVLLLLLIVVPPLRAPVMPIDVTPVRAPPAARPPVEVRDVAVRAPKFTLPVVLIAFPGVVPPPTPTVNVSTVKVPVGVVTVKVEAPLLIEDPVKVVAYTFAHTLPTAPKLYVLFVADTCVPDVMPFAPNPSAPLDVIAPQLSVPMPDTLLVDSVIVFRPVTPDTTPDDSVTALIVLGLAALIPPDVVNVVPLNVNVPAVAPFIVVSDPFARRTLFAAFPETRVSPGPVGPVHPVGPVFPV